MHKKPLSLAMMLAALLASNGAMAQASAETVLDFMTAHEALYQPSATSDDIEAYLRFMTDDITDYHAAYGVTLEGKDVFRENLPDKAARSISYQLVIESMQIGSNVAVVTFVEDSRSRRESDIVDFRGRTVLVLEFNNEGRITHMRRYLD